MTEWGPWIDHDGSGCPCVGEFVHRVFDAAFDRRGGENVTPSNECISICVPEEYTSWNGTKYHPLGLIPQVIRYRIRKPKGMEILTVILREVERKPELV